MLKNWIDHKNHILLQRKGSHRSRSSGVGTEDGMEHQLNNEFEKAQAAGRQITHQCDPILLSTSL
jgi:hypothetical protein